MNNRRGQAIVESILLLTAFVFLSIYVSGRFKENELVSKMVRAPWVRLSGMIQNGVWASPEQSYGLHPTSFARYVSVKGDQPK